MNQSAVSKAQQESCKWRTLITGCLAHFVHDGFTDMIYVFFPIWQAQWSLSFVAVGLLKTMVSGATALFQLPTGILASRIGSVKLLIIGTLITSVAVMSWGFAASPVFLGLLLIIGGLGSSVQHPVSSSIISDAYSDVRIRRAALSTYNFTGDIGKLVLPGAAAILITYYGWPSTSHWLATVGLAVAFLFFICTPSGRTAASSLPRQASQSGGNALLLGWKGYQAFWSLATIGVLDSATRMGFLTFLPFLLQGKGACVTQIGFTLTLIFAGGAAGKLICGILASRIGILRSVIITESMTAIGIAGMIALSLANALLLAPFLGVALNGTSSVLYGSVPELVSEGKQKQAFSIFYTMTIGAGAISPAIYGTISDFTGVTTTVMIVAVVILGTLPLTVPLRGKLAGE